MNIINLTPHEITLFSVSGEKIVLPKSDKPARCQTSTEVVGEVAGIAISRTKFGMVENLPSPITDTIFIVSKIVVEACNNRPDLFCVDQTVRDSEGKIIGAKSITQL